MTTDLAIRPDAPSMDMMTLGQMLAKSGYFQDAKETAQAIVKVLAGQEMGIGPIAAMTGIYIVKGRVTLSANLMAAQIKRSGRYNYRVTRLDDEVCTLEFFEQGTSIGTSTYSKDDAMKAGLWGQAGPWKSTPRNMLFARAVSNGAKWYTPDVFSGPVYTPDELRDTTEADNQPPADIVTGEVIEAQQAEPAPALTVPVAPKRPASRETLMQRINDLIAECDAAEMDVDLPKPLADMTTNELIQFGKLLREQMDQMPAATYTPEDAV